MNTFDVFISYSSKDKSIADQLVTHIENAGFACWIAPRDIEGGAEYSEIIENAISNCKVFVLIFSENSEKSPWVKSELNIAFSENKYLIPYIIDRTPLKGTMRLLLNDKHWITICEDESKQANLLISAIQKYFAAFEKKRTDDFQDSPYYTRIAKRQKIKKNLVYSLLLGGIIVFGIILFSIFYPRSQNMKKYYGFINEASAIKNRSINDFIETRNLLNKAQEFEKKIPISQRKNTLETLFQVQLKLDSIFYQNLDAARIFASIETVNGDNQAIERYIVALKIKEDTVVRSEYDKVLLRKRTYE